MSEDFTKDTKSLFLAFVHTTVAVHGLTILT